jgi:hypothetical protein
MKENTMTKALVPVKAQIMDTEELAAWFAGRTPRRLLAIPFGGPIPSPLSAKGVDLDNEWFDEATDIYGSVKGLRNTRERLVDWHHGKDPSGVMSRTVIGKSTLDDAPDEDGWWSTIWIKAGERRVELIRRLAERGAQLFGSSEAVYRKADPDGHIAEWPMYLQTLTTSPQNTYSVLRPSKAMLDELVNDTVDPALRRVLEDLASLGSLSSSRDALGEAAAKSGLVIDEAIGPWEATLRAKQGEN